MTGPAKIKHLSTKNCQFLYLLHYNLITIYANTTKSFPLLQNLMDFLLKFTETEYHNWNSGYK